MSCEGRLSLHLRAVPEGTVRRAVLRASTCSPSHQAGTAPHLPLPLGFVVQHYPNQTSGFVLPVAGITQPAPATSSPLGAREGRTEGGGRHLLRADAGGECTAAGPLRGLQGDRAAVPPPRQCVKERGRRRKARGRKRTGGRGVEAAPAAGRVPGPRCCVTAREEQEEECGCGEFPCVAAEEQHRSRRRGCEEGAAAAAGCRAM